MQLSVVPLWSLLEACRAGTAEEQREAAEVAAASVRARGATLTVELRGSVLVVDDFPAVSGVDTFAATHGLLELLREAQIERVRLSDTVDAEAMHAWARRVVAGPVSDGGPNGWPAGVEVRARHADEADEPRPRAAAVAGDSQLQSVFVQHRLIAGLPRIGGLDAGTAKLVVQGVVDRLLEVDGGLEPLMLLQQDEALLQRSTAVAVWTVVIARRAGWPTEQLADLGAAGLLHDLGSVLDDQAPGAAAMRWLLERGDEDFWLRSALCARRWRDGQQAQQEAAGPLAVVALVRLAAAAHRGGLDGVDDLLRGGGVPPELGEIARQTVAG